MRDVHDHDRRLMRRRMYADRLRLSAADVARWSAAGCERLVSLHAFAAARHVVVYAAIGNELDPAAVAEHAAAAGKRVYYPDPDQDAHEPSFRHVPERPAAGGPNGRLLDVDETGILFVVPGVAFDVRGARLGRGYGWYDRALARYPAAARVGLAYDFQIVPELPVAAWDVRMHAVVTEARLLGDAARLTGD
jgi:5-formyltetrahydrofolate cyclo-ligase